MSDNLSLYQARNGKIYLLNGINFTPLTREQIKDLHLCVFNLDDFDFDDYVKAYGIEADEYEMEAQP